MYLNIGEQQHKTTTQLNNLDLTGVHLKTSEELGIVIRMLGTGGKVVCLTLW